MEIAHIELLKEYIDLRLENHFEKLRIDSIRVIYCDELLIRNGTVTIDGEYITGVREISLSMDHLEETWIDRINEVKTNDCYIERLKVRINK